MISKESQIIYLLTGWLPSIEKDDQIKPLSAKEWSIVAQKIYASELNKPSDLQSKSQIEISSILNLDSELSERIIQLLTRSGQVVFEIEKYRTQGYNLLTRADDDYPKKLIKIMQMEMPPYFWYIGDINIVNESIISIQFPNSKDESLSSLIKDIVIEVKNNNYSMALSFNDEYSFEVAEEAINHEIQVLGIIPFGMLKLTKQPLIRDLLATKKLLLLSQSYPSISKYYKYNGMLQKKVELAIADKIMLLNSGTLNEITYSELQKSTNDEIYVYNMDNNLKSNNKLSQYITIDNVAQIFSTETIEPSIEVVDNVDYNKNNVIFTIGHSNHTIEKFIELLIMNNIQLIIDVRSVPKSGYTPHFNKMNLINYLKRNNIKYRDMGKTLGGRPDKTDLLFEYKKTSRSKIALKIREDKIEQEEWYNDAIDQLITLSREKNIALMCAEENPEECHRGYIISHSLLKKSITINHIRKSGGIDKGKRFSKPWDQIGFFDFI